MDRMGLEKKARKRILITGVIGIVLILTDFAVSAANRGIDLVQTERGVYMVRPEKGEEVGHGAATVGGDADELLAVDMGCVGADLACKETQVSVCVKDGHGPYDYEMVERLLSLAKANQIDFAADVYPYYGSDVGAAWDAGADVKGGLIGPGVHASHGMERTHLKGVCATISLLCAYLGL